MATYTIPYLNVLKHKLITSGVYDLQKHFGLKADGSADGTQAIIDAITAAAANGQQGAVLQFPAGLVLIGGALNTGATAGNSQISLPDRGLVAGSVAGGLGLSLTFRGAMHPAWTNGGYLAGVVVPRSGTVLQSTIQGSGTDPAVFGGKGSGTGSITNVDVLFENLTVRTLGNTAAAGPTLTAVDMRYASTAAFRDFTADLDVIGYNSVLPVANTYGIRGVLSGAETFNDYYRTLALGYRTGYAMGEHSNGTQVQTMCCLNGIEFTRSDHDIHLGRVCLQWTKNGLVASGQARVIVENYDIENIHVGHWYDNAAGDGGYHVLDPNGFLLGGCFFNVTTSNVGRDNANFFKSGGAGFNCVDGEKFPGAGVAASGSSTASFVLSLAGAPASGSATAALPTGVAITAANNLNATTGFTLRNGTNGTAAEQWVAETSAKYENSAGGYVFGSATGTTDDNRPSFLLFPQARYMSFYLPADASGCVASLRIGPTLVNASVDLSAPEVRNSYLFFLLDLGANWATTVQAAGYGVRVSNTDTTGTKKLYLPTVAHTTTAPSLAAAPAASVGSAATFYNGANRVYNPAANWLADTNTVYAAGAGKYSSTVGDFYTDVFTGTGVDIGTPVGTAEGTLDVYVDGVLAATVKATAAAAGSSITLPLVSGALRGFAAGSHTIKVVNKGGGTGNIGLSDRIQGVA